MCAGIKPDQNPKTSSSLTGVVEIFSAIIIIALHLKINIHKKKLTVQGATDVNEIEKHSLTSLASIFFAICYLGCLATMLVILNNQKPEDLSKFPYFVMCYYRSLLSPTMCIILLVLLCVFNKKYLQAVLDEFGDLKN
jgi:L-cystine uptake protein TcyP (sodium:dicarboxylate symporter family)